MKQFFFRLAFTAAALLPASSVLAADLDVPPPPVEELRPTTFDWSGPYAGAFIGGVAESGNFETSCSLCLGTSYGELNGIGWNGGVLAGWNYQMESFVMGVEGDWAFGGQVAKNSEASQQNELDFNNVATLRARAGMAFDNTLVYVTGGAAFVDTTFHTDDLAGLSADDSKWVTGWVIGGGMEHAFSDRLSGRIEYTYMSLPDTSYSLSNANSAIDVDYDYVGVHTIRAGLTYNFGW